MENNKFEDWGRKLSALLPESASQIKQDIEKNIKFLVKDAIKRIKEITEIFKIDFKRLTYAYIRDEMS